MLARFAKNKVMKKYFDKTRPSKPKVAPEKGILYQERI